MSKNGQEVTEVFGDALWASGMDARDGNIADGIFAVARALQDLTTAVYETLGGPWPSALAAALRDEDFRA